ncbi:abortive phage resistance protein [Enterobacter asburiae]|uniref:AbiTii domain-containing protein n=1 Tax=Enterobacter asburiae TaxID=61645 RepID=UPI001F4E66EA|nr:abortive phage resistance protein [Enterobacter asburiae]UNG06906.1 abortive phage resistance protein [Enterobacter asburiae]
MASLSSTDIEELLSKAKMISVKLDLKDISDWLEYELNGYPSFKFLPEYRIIKDVRIRAFNPYAGWIPYQLGNITEDSRDICEHLTTVHINNPVSMLSEYAKSENTLYSELPSELADYLQEISDCDFRMAWSINPTQIKKIISNVKSRILDWTLLLEKKGVLGEGLLFSKEEKMEALGMTVNNINNFHGDVNNAGAIGAGNAGNISQQNSISVGDIASLERELKSHGLDDNDVAELKQLVEQSPKPASKGEVEKGFGAWIGKMTGKAFTGALKVAGAAAPAVLTNAICCYFGIPV